MSVYDIEVKCDPAGLPRNQSRVVTDKSGMPVKSKKTGRYTVNNYQPKKTSTGKKHPAVIMQEAIVNAAKKVGAKPIKKPKAVTVTIYAYLKRPQRLKRKSDPKYPIPHTGKPDIDNIAKAVLDALNGIAYEDDSQICKVDASKWYCFNTNLGDIDDPGLNIWIVEYEEVRND